MGQPRFAELMEMIPSDLTILGIDEKTALVIEPQSCTCRVIGLGGVTLIHAGPAHRSAARPASLNGTGLHEVAQIRQAHIHQYPNGQSFSLGRIGSFRQPEAGAGLSPKVWQRALEVRQAPRFSEVRTVSENFPPENVIFLMEKRQEARANKDWPASDRLRQQITDLGWQVQDTPEGPKIVRLENRE